MRETAERGLHVCGLDGLVEAVVGLDDVPCPKPDPAPLHLARERIGVAGPDAVMVGDAPADLAAGLAAGAWPVGVARSLFARALARGGRRRPCRPVPVEGGRRRDRTSGAYGAR